MKIMRMLVFADSHLPMKSAKLIYHKKSVVPRKALPTIFLLHCRYTYLTACRSDDHYNIIIVHIQTLYTTHNHKLPISDGFFLVKEEYPQIDPTNIVEVKLQ